MARFDLTDAEWALIEPHVPVAATGPLPRRAREQFNGILWRFRTGSGWRDVPKRYGPWSTVYSRFDAWAKAGVFQTLMDALIAEAASRGQVGLELVSVDSTIVRAHHESAGLAVAGETLDALEQALTEEKGAPLPTQQSVLRVMRRAPHRTPPTRARLPIGTVPPSGGAGRHGLRRPGSAGPRGGLSSKVHAAVDAAGLPPAFVLTPGQAADSPQFRTVLDRIRVPGRVGRPRTRPDAVADKAYSSKANRKKKGSTGGRPVSFDPVRYRRRNTAERCFQKIKAWRGLATRYDKTPQSYEAGLHLRGSIMWLKTLTPAT